MLPSASRPGSTGLVRLVTGTLAALSAVFAAVVWPSAQTQSPPMDLVVGRNVNIVSGQTLPNGDPYLQRQNEPSVAASTRNPLHLLAGANDYRTVDIPGKFDDGETGDAWLGVFKSFDGGERWQSTLLPGYPQDESAEGKSSPLKAYHAGADPVVRPGTNGLLYYAGLAFNRGEGGASAIFVSRFVDNNNKENGDPIAYISTSIVAKSNGKEFLDKPWMAVDVPRAGATVCRISTQQAAPKVLGSDTRVTSTGTGADGVAVSAAAQTIKTTRTTQGTPAVLPTPGVAKATTVNQQVLAGTMYVAYAQITTTTLATGGSDIESRIMFSRSDDCGTTWTTPVRISDPAHKVNQGATIAVDPATGAVHVAWRQFGLSATAPDAIMTVSPTITAKVAKKPVKVHEFKPGPKADAIQPKLQRAHRHGDVHQLVSIRPFDSGTGEDRFRTNAYPTMAIDDESRVYLAWTERGYAGARPEPLSGDARVVLATSKTPGVWTTPRPVDSEPAGTDRPGHQMMPSMSYSGGRLLLVYYDLRQDVSQVFGTFVSENEALSSNVRRRHTIDVRAVQAPKGDLPAFGASTMVSQYLMGNRRGDTQREQLQFNAPNLPLFQLGTVPFMGDYIDVAPAPAFVQDPGGKWIHNTANTSAPVFHAVWTDNRDVRQPKDGKWENYTPPGVGCVDGQAGMRNQNVYSARITMGLMAGSPGNTKPLSTDLPRGFVVFAQNLTYQTKTFRLTIQNQPVGGDASFNQLGLVPASELLLKVDVRVAPRSMVTRTVYATSTNAKEQVRVSIVEVGPLQGAEPIAGGLATTVVLNPDISNPDISNPDISNPDISNPDISNPDISNAEVYNPDISNPDISNPDISNPDISNPDISNPDISNARIANPDISNPDISNPDISNPDISNPDISNPDISNGTLTDKSLTDVTWTIRNDGNTTASFNVNLFLANQAAAAGGIKTQLVVHKTYKTPVSDGCVLKSQSQTVLVATVDDPVFLTAGQDPAFDPANPDISNTTLWLEPGGEGKITLRILDLDPTDNVTINPVTDVTPVVQSLAVNTLQLGDPTPEPPATPLPTDPQPTAATVLAFVAQPVNTLVSVLMPDITVSAFAGANAAPGVQVTLAIAINPSGGNLVGTVTTLTDAAGLATFSGLLINRDGANYRLSASASASGALPVLSTAFTVGAVVQPPALDLTGSWSGTYAWNCGGALTGSASIAFTINAPHFGGWLSAGTTTYLGGTAGASIARFTGALGNSDPAGTLIQLIVNPGSPGNFVNNEFVGTLTNPGVMTITGTTINGDSNGGCSAAGPAGTFTITKTPSPFVVTTTADAGIGSLRDAVTLANTTAGYDSITFNIAGAGEHVVTLATALPALGSAMAIMGETQPGYDGRPWVRVHGAPGIGRGFEAFAPVKIRGLAVTGFQSDAAVLLNNGASGSVIAQNHLGTDRNGASGLGNHTGVHLNYVNTVTVRQNLLSGNAFSGIGMSGGSGSTITQNHIGTGVGGLGALPNLDNGITMFDGTSATLIDNNVISGNGTVGAGNGFGIDIQQSGGLANVTNTVITNNVIGLDAAGNLISRGGADWADPGPTFANFGPRNRGNAGGGIRVNRGSGTIIGGNGAGNTISGNSNTGVYLTGAVTVAPVLRGNKIGTDPTGTQARGNRRGVEVFLSTAVVGLPGAGNGNQVSGNLSDGIWANGNTTIENNLVGVNALATLALGNARMLGGGTPEEIGCCHTGIFVAAPNNVVRGNVVGGSIAHDQDPGIRSSDGLAGQAPNLIEDNFVGTNSTGTAVFGNGIGIGLYIDKAGTIVRRNVVAHSVTAGIWLVEGTDDAVIGGAAGDGNIVRNGSGRGIQVGYNAGTNDTRNVLTFNRVFGNVGLGIDLGGNGVTANDPGDSDTGPNRLMNFPVLSNVNSGGATTAVNMVLDTDTPNAKYDIQVFASTACHATGFGQGERLVGSFERTSDGAGDIVSTLVLAEAVPAGQFLTATATSANTGTSEFSQCVAVPAGATGSIASASPANEAPGEGFMVLRGSNLPATIGDVIAEVSNGVTTMNGFWFGGPSSATAGYVRMPPGMPLGAATVRLRNGAGTAFTNAFPITITNVPGIPVITNVLDGSTNPITAPVATGSWIFVQADGIDTTGAVVRFTQGTTNWDVAAELVASSASVGMVARATVPAAAAGGPLSVSIRQGASAFSPTAAISVQASGPATLVGPVGGGGGSAFGPIMCPGGSVATAFRGRAGDDVDRTDLWCSTVQAGPSLGTAAFAGGVGGGGGSDYGSALTCPAGAVMTGIHGTAGSVVDSLGVTCTYLAGGTYQSTAIGSPGVGYSPGGFFALNCAVGQEVVGFVGRQGALLDQIGIYCSNAAAPAPQPAADAAALAPVTFGPQPSRPSPLTR